MNEPQDLTAMRRKDQAKDDHWIRAFLAGSEFGTIATARDGQPFMVTRNFVYDTETHAVYMHGARRGRTIENADGGPRACFSASRSGRLLPHARAKELGTEFAGVVAFGRLRIVEDVEEARRALQLICDKYFPHLEPGKDYEPTTDDDLRVTAVIRFDIEQWSGKELKEADDFPGAFRFGEPPA
jgi:nitroimidazol reductase NimA-like FMN-containing flavoprotein (pyridoxamine 5'-phosphate oxidase superfamily)